MVFFRMKIKDLLDAEVGYMQDEVAHHQDGDLYNSVNPSMPPPSQACSHQKESGFCAIKSCEEKVKPAGVNLGIHWDKNSDQTGNSFLHLPKEIHTLIKVYFVKRLKQFGIEDQFLKKDLDLNKFLFVNGKGKPFKTLDLSHMRDGKSGSGKKVKAFDHRKKISTWAQSHPDKEVRELEPESLQHRKEVASRYYLLNNMSKPQKLVQLYAKEHEVFPSNIVESIAQAEDRVEDILNCQENVGKEARIETLVKEKDEKTSLRKANQELGPKRRILHVDCLRFVELMNLFHRPGMMQEMKSWKPLEWRHLVVRTVCTAKGDIGENLRELWKKVYRGDLRWGIRDCRSEAKLKNWPLRGVSPRNDRNSWIAAYLKKYIANLFPKK